MNSEFSITEQKNQLRQQMRQIRRAMPPEKREAADKAICEAVLAHPDFMRAKQIFAYVAMPIEVQTKGILEACLAMGKTLALPVCETASHAISGGTISGCIISAIISLISAMFGGHLFIDICF